MKKFTYLALAFAMTVSLTACGGKQPTQADNSDKIYVQDKGTLVVGITEFEPMDYQNANGEWIGFDADLAKAFAESLGVEAEFQVIEWDNKTMELEGKTIDVVWNGMTLTDEVKSAMACSNPYFNNAQVVIVKSDKAAQYQTADSVKSLNFAVENGSAGQEQVEAIGPLDAVLIPVGGTYTVDAAGAKAVCEALNPKCVIPMHYRHAPYGLPNVAGVEDFLSLWPVGAVRRLEGPVCEVDGGASGVLVPQFLQEA